MSRIEEIRAYVHAHPNRTHGPASSADALFLLAELDKVTADFQSWRLSCLNDHHFKTDCDAEMKAELDAARRALKKIWRGSCPCDPAIGLRCFPCIAGEARARLGGGK